MRKLRALFLVNLKAMLFSSHMGRGGKRRAASGAGVIVLMAFLALYLSGTYSFLFAGQLAPMGLLPLIIMMMPVLAVVFGLMFSVFAAQGILFGGKDNDLVLALPVSPFTLMLSRTLALYLENLVFTVFVMLPAGAAYLIYGGGGGPAFVLALLLGSLLVALIPTCLAMVCGFVLSWISGKFVRKTAVTMVLYLALLVGGILAGTRLSLLMSDLASAAMGLEGAFSGWGLPFLLLKEAACDGDALSLLALCALCLLPFLALVWLFGTRYKQIVTGLSGRGARTDYRLGRVAAGNARRALLKKEAKRFFGTPIYFFNAGAGLILLLGGSVFALFQREAVAGLMAQMAELGADFPLLPVTAMAVAFLLSTVSITASSISLEGKYLWILKEAPVGTMDIFRAKAGFQILLTLPCLLVGVVLVSVAFSFPPLDAAALFIAGAAFSVLTALFGLYVNLCFPRLDAPNDMVVVKQSASAMIGMFCPMLAVAAGILLYMALGGVLGMAGTVLVWAALCLAGAAVLLRLLNTRGKRLFEELS